MEEARKAFDQFIQVVRTFTHNDGYDIIKLLVQGFKKAEESFLISPEFIQMLKKTESSIVANKTKTYVLLLEFETELGAYARKRKSKKEVTVTKKKKRQKDVTEPLRDPPPAELPPEPPKTPPRQREVPAQLSPVVLIESRIKVPPSCVSRKIFQKPSTSKGDKAPERNPFDSPGNKKLIKQRGSEKQIQRLETLLAEIRDKIEELERKELSIDELADEDTSYLLIDRFKKRFVKVWNKLCEVKGRESTTGRATERKFFYAGSKYPEIDKRIQRFINRKKEFPDYHDIHRIVSACNEKFDLHLNKSYIAQIAKETFVDVGQRLQERRQEDFAENFGCQLTDELKSSKDPALNDAELSRRLASNKKLGNSKMEEVIVRYARRQETHGDATDSGNEESSDEDCKPDLLNTSISPIHDENARVDCSDGVAEDVLNGEEDPPGEVGDGPPEIIEDSQELVEGHLEKVKVVGKMADGTSEIIEDSPEVIEDPAEIIENSHEILDDGPPERMDVDSPEMFEDSLQMLEDVHEKVEENERDKVEDAENKSDCILSALNLQPKANVIDRKEQSDGEKGEAPLPDAMATTSPDSPAITAEGNTSNDLSNDLSSDKLDELMGEDTMDFSEECGKENALESAVEETEVHDEAIHSAAAKLPETPSPTSETEDESPLEEDKEQITSNDKPHPIPASSAESDTDEVMTDEVMTDDHQLNPCSIEACVSLDETTDKSESSAKQSSTDVTPEKERSSASPPPLKISSSSSSDDDRAPATKKQETPKESDDDDSDLELVSISKPKKIERPAKATVVAPTVSARTALSDTPVKSFVSGRKAYSHALNQIPKASSAAQRNTPPLVHPPHLALRPSALVSHHKHNTPVVRNFQQLPLLQNSRSSARKTFQQTPPQVTSKASASTKRPLPPYPQSSSTAAAKKSRSKFQVARDPGQLSEPATKILNAQQAQLHRICQQVTSGAIRSMQKNVPVKNVTEAVITLDDDSDDESTRKPQTQCLKVKSYCSLSAKILVDADGKVTEFKKKKSVKQSRHSPALTKSSNTKSSAEVICLSD